MICEAYHIHSLIPAYNPPIRYFNLAPSKHKYIETQSGDAWLEVHPYWCWQAFGDVIGSLFHIPSSNYLPGFNTWTNSQESGLDKQDVLSPLYIFLKIIHKNDLGLFWWLGKESWR